MSKTKLAQIRKRLVSERGFAGVMAIGATAALTFAAAGSIAYTTQNSGGAARSKADAAALALAEAGINNAVAVIANPANDPRNPNLLSPAQSFKYETGTAMWWGSFDAAGSRWNVTATGEVRNPTGPAATPARRIVTAVVPVREAGATSGLGNQSWNYMFATRTGNTCDMTLSSGAMVSAPLYTMGNLCLGSSSKVTAGPLAVRGALSLGTDGTVGTLATPVSRVDVAGGCSGHPCTSADRVYASTLTASPPMITPPTPEWDYWYANAKPGPKQGCDFASGVVPVFDTNTVRDKSVATVFHLTPATSSYSCRVGSADNPRGELSWNHTTKTLTVRGTIFIDGQAKVENGYLNTYVGQGVLYLSGSYYMANGSKLCAVAGAGDCDFNNWNPNQNFFAIVTNGNGGYGVYTGNSVNVSCYDRFQGGLFATNAVQFGAGAKHQGPLVASTIVLGSNVELKPFGNLDTVPSGLPGNRPVEVGAPQDFSS